MPRRHPIVHYGRHVRAVAARRFRHGPRLPGWGFAHEVVQSVMREQFARTGAPPAKVRRRIDAAAQVSPKRGCDIVWGDLEGVSSAMVAPRRRRTDRLMLYLHGGGYVFGSPRSHQVLLTGIAREAGGRVLALDYRLAPEHPCPAAIDDVLTAWRSLLDRGIDPSSVTIAGDSAGGGLTLTSLLAMREADLPMPSRAVLLSPWTDLEVSGDSARENTEHDYLTPADGLFAYGAHYAGDLDRRDPRVSPLHAPDLTGLPPMIVLAGGVEVIRDDSTRMAARLRDAGVDVDLHVELTGVHVYPIFHDLNRASRDGLARIVGFHLGG